MGKHYPKSFKEAFSIASQGEVKGNTFLTTEDKKYPFTNLTTKVNKINTLLKSKGLERGDNILLSLSHDFDMFCMCFAMILNGITVIPVDPNTKKNKVKGILSNARIDGWIIDKKNEEYWSLDSSKKHIVFEASKASENSLINRLLKKNNTQENTLDSAIENCVEDNNYADISPDTVCFLIYTSGTTSDPKGVLLTHNNIISHLATLSKQYQLNKDSVLLNILPCFHVDGLIQGPILSLFNSTQLVRPFRYQISKIPDLLDTVYKYKISHFFVVPTMLYMFDRFSTNPKEHFNTKEFKYLISSAGNLESNFWDRFMTKFEVKLINVYGLTETVAGGLFCGPDEETWKLGSIGKPIDCEAKVIDANGNTILNNEVGELALRGEHIMKSYLHPKSNPDQNGWFFTGDLVERDSEGFYYIKGRKKNVIIVGGVNIYPEQIIETLNQSSLIHESFVYGEINEVGGEKIIAAICANDNVEVGDIKAFCNENLLCNQTPSEIHLLDKLPTTASGKVSKELVIEKIKKVKEQSNEKHSSGDIKEKIISVASESFNYNFKDYEINLGPNDIDGWSSIAHLDFIVQIEKKFGLEISVKEIMGIDSISKSIEIVNKKISR
ncbi:AMP-binding protein [Aquimarina sp. 2201CG1-2-11]|uniref:AMP-binding protein n=1 Tax=Aquimarina discodermiae TaxID=3231043 RepID=UPI0034632241